jgi:homoserine O-acetyltransferase/O-succinyltransferase
MIVTPRSAVFDRPLSLDSGRELSEFTIGYETHGELNRAGDNAILICHGLTHDAHAAGKHTPDDARPGWWDLAIGPGKPFDSERYFVVCPNVIGGCGGSSGPASPDPNTGKPYALKFPVVTIGDMAAAQARLADRLGVERWRSVAGGCMGGYQVMEWMSRFPQRVASAVVISATPATSAHTLALWEVVRQAIMGDPNFNGGDYYDGDWPLAGLGLSSMVGMVIWMSRQVMAQRFGRKLAGREELSYELEPDFAIQAFFQKIGDNADKRFDPNSLIYLTKAMDYFDLYRGRAELAEAFAGTGCQTLLVSYDSDWRYPSQEMEDIRLALAKVGAPVEHRILSSPFGHGAFAYDGEGLCKVLAEFLA